MKFIAFKLILSLLILTPMANIEAQNNSKTENMSYYHIPDHPEDFSSGNIISRMIDGLGYRFYWASEGLRDEDLLYKPSEEARTSRQTLEHILGLSNTILNGSKNIPNEGRINYDVLSYEEMRTMTLERIREASKLMRGKSAEDISELKVVFKRGEKETEYPYWNMINGPIEDAIWHCGQLVSFRRASGNPLRKGVSVLSGKTRDL